MKANHFNVYSTVAYQEGLQLPTNHGHQSTAPGRRAVCSNVPVPVTSAAFFLHAQAQLTALVNVVLQCTHVLSSTGIPIIQKKTIIQFSLQKGKFS